MTFEVPEGMVPVGFSASLEGTTETELRVRTGDRLVATASTTSPTVSFDLEPGDVSEAGQLTLTFALPPGTWCDLDNSGGGVGYYVSVTEATLYLTGQSAAPESVADFFSAQAQSATVNIQEGAAYSLSEAALQMVASATAALGSKEVHLTVGGQSPQPVESQEDETEVPPFAQRRVELVQATGVLTSEITVGADGVPTLTLSGTPDGLVSAAKAFASQGIALATASSTSGLKGSVSSPANAQTLTLASLGTATANLEGYGRQDLLIPISQGAFGRNVAPMTIQLSGAVSTTDTTVGTVQFLWNDVLVDSFQLDTETSTVSAVSAGYSKTSFQLFPQSFGENVQVAFGANPPTTARLSGAAELVSALQRATPQPLQISLTTAQQLIAESAAGILVGPTQEQAELLGTPLYFTDPRLINDAQGTVSVSVDQPYAALQAVIEKGRPLLVLGSYRGDGQGNQAPELMTAVSGLPGTSWWNLDGDVRLATQGNSAITIDTQPDVEAEEQVSAGSVTRRVAVGVAVVAVGIATIFSLRALARSRRKFAEEQRLLEEGIDSDRAAPKSDES